MSCIVSYRNSRFLTNTWATLHNLEVQLKVSHILTAIVINVETELRSGRHVKLTSCKVIYLSH